MFLKWYAVALMLLPALKFEATTHTWNASGGGNYSTTTNWTPNGVPGPSDQATFPNFGPSYTVSYTSAVPSTAILISASSTVNLSIGNGASATASITIGNLSHGTVSFAGNGSFTTHSIQGNGFPVTITLAPNNNGTLNLGSVFEQNGALIDVSFAGVGTLQISGAANISDLNAAQSSATLNFTSGGISLSNGTSLNSSFAGVVMGSGSFSVGAGSLTLTNPSNSFTNGVFLSGGATLIVPSGTCIGSGALSFSGGGTLAPSASITMNQGIRFSNSVIGTIDATAGAFEYTGMITAADGASLNTIGSVSLNTISIASGTFTVAGNLTGSQTLTVQDGGTVVLSGANTYTNGTVVASNTTLSIGSQSNIGGGAAALTLSGGTLHSTGSVTTSGNIGVTASSTIDGTMGSVTFSGTLTGSDGATLSCLGNTSLNTVTLPSGTFTISGSLAGSQPFTKAGGGTLVMTSNNTYTEQTTVSAGTLTFSSATTAGPVAVSPGAIFNGVGTVGGNLIMNGGTVRPGNSPGTMTITGNFNVPVSSSIIAIEVVDTGQTSLLDITGSANLNGNGIVQFTADPGTYIEGMSFTFLNAAGGVNGEFASSNLAGLFPGLNPILIYKPFSVELFLGPFIPSSGINLSGLTGNNLAVAIYLNSLSASDLGSSFTTLAGLNGDTLDQALSTISPSRNSFATYVSEITLFSCSSLLNARASTLRLARGIATSSSLLSENDQLNDSTPDCDAVCLSSNVDSPISVLSTGFGRGEKRKPANRNPLPVYDEARNSPPICPDDAMALWGIGFGELARQKSADQNPRFHVGTGGAMAGFDWVSSDIPCLKLDSALFGVAAVYFHSSIDQAEDFGHNDLDAGSLCLYGTVFASHFYLEGSLWNGIQSMHNSRNVFFSDFTARAKSHHNAYIGDTHLGIGYDVELQYGSFQAIFEPFAALDWAWDWEVKYHEEGASPYNMQFKSHFSSMLQAEAGIYFLAGWDCSKAILILKQKASYLHRTPFHVGTLSSHLVGFPGSFTVTSFHREQNLVSPSTELTLRSRNGFYVSLLYDGEFGSDWMMNELAARVGCHF